MSNKNILVSAHAKMRVKERCVIKRNELQRENFDKALHQGVHINKINGELYDYIMKKNERHRKRDNSHDENVDIKVYQNMIYIFSIGQDHKTFKLITVLKIPRKYLPISKYVEKGKKDDKKVD